MYESFVYIYNNFVFISLIKKKFDKVYVNSFESKTLHIVTMYPIIESLLI
jgi:hypothetical protein